LSPIAAGLGQDPVLVVELSVLAGLSELGLVSALLPALDEGAELFSVDASDEVSDGANVLDFPFPLVLFPFDAE
jgi:hypothetical protein